MNTFTNSMDAINYICDRLNVYQDEALWIYENTSCPRWDDESFTSYNFLEDPNVAGFSRLPQIAASHDYELRIGLSGSQACAMVPYERGPTYLFANEASMKAFASKLWSI